MSKKKTNILVWPRAAGIGDTFSVLAVGMIVFNEEPFQLIIGCVTEVLRRCDKNYVQQYEDIADAFTLCTKTTMCHYESEDEAVQYANSMRVQEATVHVVTDMGWALYRAQMKKIRECFPIK